MSGSDDSTRPISVAELLARNGSIGSPPVGGHRRRRRRNSNTVSVAELTGEIPVVRGDESLADEVAPVVHDGATESADTVVYEATVYEATVYEDAADEATVENVVDENVAADTVVVDEDPVDEDPVDEDPVYEDTVDEATVYEDPVDEDPVVAAPIVEDTVHEAAAEESAQPVAPPPLSRKPLPSRRRGPERSYDPRPLRRASGAEQMAYDPVDQSVDLADLVDEQDGNADELRSYLRSSGGTLFSGETVADDLARRGIPTGSDDIAEVAQAEPRGKLNGLWLGVLTVLQSMLAVVFGAGLFIAFDQLWRWNDIVALVLSVLVILGLVVAVRMVRKTEDIASTLIAVAVGALVTLGPLALLQST